MNGEHGRSDAPDDRFPQYRHAGFDEVPPPDVDRTVLAEAARTAAHHRRRRRAAHLAWAAAVVLSVALVLEIGVRPPAPPERMLSEPAADRGGTTLRDTPARALREAAEPDGDLGARREALDSAAPQRFAAPAPDAARGSSGAPEGASGDAPAAAARAPRCSEEIRGSAAAWLDCIAELRRAGEDAAADAELDALRRRYPAALDDENRTVR